MSGYCLLHQRRPATTAPLQCKVSCRLLTPPHCSSRNALTDVGKAELQFWDVVEYNSSTATGALNRRLGLVQQVTADCIEVSPMVEEDDGVWVPDDEVDLQQIQLSNVVQVVDHVYGQRQDQEHNPHGEHAHDVWQVLGPIPQEVYRGVFRP